LYYLIKHLNAQALVVSLSQGGYWADPLRNLGAAVIELQRGSGYDFSRLSALVRIIQTGRPEIVHVFLDTRSGLYGRLAALLSGHRCVVIGERYETATETYWYQALKRLLNTQVRAVITNSESNLNYLISRRMANKKKLFCIQNGIELDSFVNSLAIAPNATAWQRIRGRPVVGTVGSLFPVKAPETFVRVAAQVLARRPETLFVHVGDGPLRERMKVVGQQLGVQDSLLFLGERQDVPQLLAAMDVFVSTSHSEGMPNAVMEAMAAGLPCVVTDAGGCRELVVDGHTGFVVPLCDEEALVDRILRLLENAAMRRQMGFSGRNRIEAFDAIRMAKKYEKVYQQVLAGA
jgi:glycosyltransferase involved in cell wall biosynthesis